MTVSKSGFEPVAATVLLTFCEKLRTVPSDHFRGGVNGFFILHKSYLPSSTPISSSTMPNSTRRRTGNRAASPAMMHENTRSRTATASGGTPSLAREEADDEAAALIRQADGDTTGAALTSSPPRNPDSESDDGSDSSDSPNDDAAADAVASRRRTAQRLDELEESQPTPHAGLAAAQFAAAGIEMLPGSATDLGTSAGPETTPAQLGDRTRVHDRPALARRLQARVSGTTARGLPAGGDAAGSWAAACLGGAAAG